MLPKEYAFKIQSVTKNSKGEDERKTIGKVKVRGALLLNAVLWPGGHAWTHLTGALSTVSGPLRVQVDLAQFCDCQTDPQPQDIFLQCK